MLSAGRGPPRPGRTQAASDPLPRTCPPRPLFLLLILLVSPPMSTAWPYEYRPLSHCPGPEWNVMCRGCCEYDVIRCKCPLQGSPVGYAVPCCRNAINECDPCIIHPGCSIFENCKRCNNGTWGPRDDFFIRGKYCAECRPGWSGGDCLKCGGVIHKRQGHLVLESYPTNARCEWTVQVDRAFTIDFRFMMLSLEFDHSCRYDYVEVRDGDSVNARVIGRFCGNDRPAPIQSSGSSLHVLFVSDGYKNFDGFFATFQESSACSSSPCLHDGTCVLDTSYSFHCACLAGYTGQRCENVVGCRRPPVPTHGSAEGVFHHSGARVVFRCDPGFELRGFRKAVCLLDGTWSAPAPQCVPMEKFCAIPPKPVHGDHFLVYGPNDVLIALQYLCYRPYKLTGTSQRTCLPNSTWSGAPPTCAQVNNTLAEPDKDRGRDAEKDKEKVLETDEGPERQEDKERGNTTESGESVGGGDSEDRNATSTADGQDKYTETGLDRTKQEVDRAETDDHLNAVERKTAEPDTPPEDTTGKDVRPDTEAGRDVMEENGHTTDITVSRDKGQGEGEKKGGQVDESASPDQVGPNDTKQRGDTFERYWEVVEVTPANRTDPFHTNDVESSGNVTATNGLSEGTAIATGSDGSRYRAGGEDGTRPTERPATEDTEGSTRAGPEERPATEDTEGTTGVRPEERPTTEDTNGTTGVRPEERPATEDTNGTTGVRPEERPATEDTNGTTGVRPEERPATEDTNGTTGVRPEERPATEDTNGTTTVRPTERPSTKDTEGTTRVRPTERPATKDTEGTTRVRPTERPATKDTEGTTGVRPTERPATKDTEGTTGVRPTERPATKDTEGTTTVRPTERPATKDTEGTTTVRPTERPATKDTEGTTTVRPTERPATKDTEGTTGVRPEEEGSDGRTKEQSEEEKAENQIISDNERKSCPPLPRLYHGYHQLVAGPAPETVEFFCNHSYALSGGARRTCQPDGIWTGTQPLCVRACREPKVSELVRQRVLPLHIPSRKTPVHKLYSSGSARQFLSVGPTRGPQTLSQLPPGFHHLYTHIEYECASPYYHHTGSARRTCLKTGKWSGRHVSCSPVCGKHPTFDPQRPSEAQWPWLAAVYRRTAAAATNRAGADAKADKMAALAGSLKKGAGSGGAGAQKEAPGWQLVCSGALVNQRSVVVAAHCVTELGKLHPLDAAKVKVVMGKNFRSDLRESKGLQHLKVASISVHPNYDPLVLDSDLAVIRLLDKARIGERVLPVCLPDTQGGELTSRQGLVTGWAPTPDPRLGDEERARVGVVHLADVVPCEQQYARNGEPVSVTDNMLCARQKPDYSPSNICPADTGGVLILPALPPPPGPGGASQEEGRGGWTLLGLVSFGYNQGECDPDLYTVYTHIANFKYWIESNMK